jgi:hypothetical protein
MAQAKTRASATRSRNAGKSQTRSRSSSSKSRASNKARTTSGKARTSGQSANASRSRSKPASNGQARVDSALHTVEDRAKDAGRAVGSAASKAKMPLVAGGAALAGAAGGLALGARQARRHKMIGMVPRRPQVKVRSRDVARAAREVGSFGAQVGHLASELQQAREANGNKKHRSPVEVVLQGLTARR